MFRPQSATSQEAKIFIDIQSFGKNLVHACQFRGVISVLQFLSQTQIQTKLFTNSWSLDLFLQHLLRRFCIELIFQYTCLLSLSLWAYSIRGMRILLARRHSHCSAIHQLSYHGYLLQSLFIISVRLSYTLLMTKCRLVNLWGRTDKTRMRLHRWYLHVSFRSLCFGQGTSNFTADIFNALAISIQKTVFCVGCETREFQSFDVDTL